MKNLKKDLLAVNKELKSLVKKTESLMKAVDKNVMPMPVKTKIAKKPVAKKPSKAEEGPTAYATFLGIVNRSKKGLSVEDLMSKTSFDRKKIANLVYKAKKQGKIKNAGKGVYVKA